MRPTQFEAREKELLALARQWLPRLPFPQVDVLLIDRIGKDISGTGLDPNVVGRKFNDHKALDDEWPKVQADCRPRPDRRHARQRHRAGHRRVLPHRNCCGETDLAATRLNGLVSGHVAAAMTPLDYATDREMLAAALGTIGLAEPPDAKLLWIADTLHLGEVECSAAYLDEARQRSDLEILTDVRELPFDAAGNLP